MNAPSQNALLIHNPNAGNGGKARRPLLDQARRILSSGGIEAELVETRGPGDATEIAQRATNEGRQLVIACGGDGTLNEVVMGSLARRTAIACRSRCFRAGRRTCWRRN